MNCIWELVLPTSDHCFFLFKLCSSMVQTCCYHLLACLQVLYWHLDSTEYSNGQQPRPVFAINSTPPFSSPSFSLSVFCCLGGWVCGDVITVKWVYCLCILDSDMVSEAWLLSGMLYCISLRKRVVLQTAVGQRRRFSERFKIALEATSSNPAFLWGRKTNCTR